MKSKCHFEIMHGSIQENEVYCAKEGKTTKLGYFCKQGYRTVIHTIKDDMRNGSSVNEIMENYTGEFVRYSNGLMKMKALIDKQKVLKQKINVSLSIIGDADDEVGPDIFRIDSTRELKFLFDGYDGEKTIVVEGMNDWIPRNYLKKMIDSLPWQINTKYGSTYKMWNHVILEDNGKRNLYDGYDHKLRKCLDKSRGNTDSALNKRYWECKTLNVL